MAVVEAVTGPDHQGGGEVVVRFAGGFEGGVGLPGLGKGEGFEAVGGSVAEASIPIYCANSQTQADCEEIIHIVQFHSGLSR